MTTERKTPCSFYAVGKCRNGSSCKFYHAPREEMAKSPLPCKFFLQNACTAGRDCKFSHTIDEEKKAALERVSASNGERSVAPGAFGVRCKFFGYGGCAAGSKCPYVHQEEEKPAARATNQLQSEQEEKRLVPASKANPQVKMFLLQKKAKNDKPTSSSEDESEQQITELSDIISKEEELYYYGAPGEFVEDEAIAAAPKLSYREIAKLHIRDDDETDSVYFHQERPAEPKKCTFFLQGLCRYGDSCFYSHSLDKPAETEDDMLKVGEELRNSADLECNICYDNILEKGERFGLLSGCTHAFCLSCVRNWRGNADQPKQTVRQCPVCRIETHFVIPSNRMITDPERKNALMDTYRENLATIPCRHFDEGLGTCPFGTSCFYAHKYPDGTLEPRQLRTAVDADGHYDVLRQVRLEHFLQSLQ